jgi:Rod binding domain-containing protein
MLGPAMPANLDLASRDLVPGRSGSTGDPLRSAATEFESLLLSQWLQETQTSFGSAPGEDQAEDPAQEQTMSFAMQSLAKGITAAGGIGLSQMIAKALCVSSERSSAAGKEAAKATAADGSGPGQV